MIRIMTSDEEDVTTVTVDGQLVDGCVDAVETCTYQAMDRGKPVRLFLRDVFYIDDRGRALLSHLARRGVHLKATGVYSSYVVTEVANEEARGTTAKASRETLLK